MIQNTKDFQRYTYNELIGSLIAHEMIYKNDENEGDKKKKKGIAFKSKKVEEKKKGVAFKASSSHIKPKCLTLKKNKFRKDKSKKAMATTWSDSDSSSDNDISDKDIANTCMVAIEEKAESSHIEDSGNEEPHTSAPATPIKEKQKLVRKEQKSKHKAETSKPSGIKAKSGKQHTATPSNVPIATGLASSALVPLTPIAAMATEILQTLSDEPVKPKRKKMTANRSKPTRRSSRFQGQD
ncbi:uncharacterized protein LOC131182095 [Hevea brasiliensis]|uniref:uncharacterized protein LOC131182095 n=1 Tax=Hevea brasiliensis TaxID=3981 RepID=UPI0025D57BA4|nr:uncharacterized protein LOC131182095 [Hevea brasiliensis]